MSRITPLQSALILFAMTLLVSPLAMGAAEQTGEFRIFGLFSPDREQDLKDVLANIPEMQLVRLDYDHARVSFRYDLETIFPNYNPKKPPKSDEIEQHLNNLLNRESNGTFRLLPPADLPPDKLTKLQIQIGILDCKGCRYAAYQAVQRVEGVDHATVTKDNVVTVWIDPAKTTKEGLQAALKKARVAIPGVNKQPD